jgi:flagellar motor component MotA
MFSAAGGYAPTIGIVGTLTIQKLPKDKNKK